MRFRVWCGDSSLPILAITHRKMSFAASAYADKVFKKWAVAKVKRPPGPPTVCVQLIGSQWIYDWVPCWTTRYHRAGEWMSSPMAHPRRWSFSPGKEPVPTSQPEFKIEDPRHYFGVTRDSILSESTVRNGNSLYYEVEFITTPVRSVSVNMLCTYNEKDYYVTETLSRSESVTIVKARYYPPIE